MRKSLLSIAFIAALCGAALGQGFSASGGGGTPGGSNTQIQFNNSGAFGGSANLTWDNTNSRLSVGGSAAHNVIRGNGDGLTFGDVPGHNAVSIYGAVGWGKSLRLDRDLSLAWNSGSYTSGADTGIRRKAAASIAFGNADEAAPTAQTLSVQSVVAGTTNTAGVLWTFKDSAGTGTGKSGGYEFDTAAVGASGTAQNTAASAFTIGVIGDTVVQIKKAQTVANLPTCNAGAQGSMAVVTDANATTFHTTAAGGGANVMKVFCDGTNWYLD